MSERTSAQAGRQRKPGPRRQVVLDDAVRWGWNAVLVQKVVKKWAVWLREDRIRAAFPPLAYHAAQASLDMITQDRVRVFADDGLGAFQTHGLDELQCFGELAAALRELHHPENPGGWVVKFGSRYQRNGLVSWDELEKWIRSYTHGKTITAGALKKAAKRLGFTIGCS